jgi:hypothetical protein
MLKTTSSPSFGSKTPREAPGTILEVAAKPLPTLYYGAWFYMKE